MTAWRCAPGTSSPHAAQANRAFAPRAETGRARRSPICSRWTTPAFRQVFAGSPIKRIGRDRMVRNCLIAAGNSGSAGLVPTVERLLADPSPVVREAADWALARLR